MPTKDMDRRASSAQLAFVTRTIDDMSHHGIHRFAAPHRTMSPGITILYRRIYAPKSTTNPDVSTGAFSLTKTATGILFKFSNIDDFQAVYKKGFHKVTGARFYKKVAIPCRPAKTFTVYVLDVPEELPEEDIRHALYKYRSIVEITRLPLNTGTVLKAINDKLKSDAHSQNEPATIYTGPPVIRVTLASVEETSTLLSRGLDFYGATYFPTETPHPAAQPLAKYKNNRWLELAAVGAGQRVRDLLPVFDNAGFNKLPPPASRLIKPQKN
ncbi:uncharacterized protein LOC122574450 isoform X2 [Bombus pyrosoma]|uniref:uncharacterized protein LOC122574450 isoform X2 n=1 Tax=Bombus pyrosoma TaxID=396416 RepID=UPI001CB9B7F7|nr:uncharacterized protein LOC122574450 isoform X2 [Bombus pyrosoma]